MRLFTPGQSKRLNEVTGFLFLAAGILFLLSMASFHRQDPSWDTVAGAVRTGNLVGPVGAHMADLFLQSFGLAAFLFPVLIFALGWKWIRSEAVEAPIIKLLGSAAMVASACGAAALLPEWRLFDHTILPGGAAGFLIADSLKHALNPAGAAVVLATALVISIYLVSSFTLAELRTWFNPLFTVFDRMRDNWRRSIERRREAALQKLEERRQESEAHAIEVQRLQYEQDTAALPPVPDPSATQRTRRRQPDPPIVESLPWDDPNETQPAATSSVATPLEETIDEIPICQLAETPPPPANLVEFPFNQPAKREAAPKRHTIYRLPSTDLLNEIPVRSAFDEQELKNTAAAIKSKFEEFNVFGSVVQINPGPVVTTFEFKPEAGIK